MNDNPKIRIIRHTVFFNAPPEDVFDLLMVSELHSEFTGDFAEVDYSEGGTFKAYGGYIQGITKRLIPHTFIEQDWWCADFDEGHFTTVIYELKRTSDGTELWFSQDNVPEKHFENISKGWYEHYWNKMKTYLNE